MDLSLHQRCALTLKGLAMDAVQAANSGHPGMPMGMADVGTVLFREILKHDPADPTWFDRDRFVLSAGHGSMLLYGLLHLSGYDLSLDDLRQFRQLGSKTPGHPEVGHTPGVETTTGPLGQGLANAVGMAIAERLLRETFGSELCDHRTYAVVSDGDLMEGVAFEAACLAGHLALGRLTLLWDDNRITIDGSADLSFTEDVLARFASATWRVLRVDGHDPEAVGDALRAARDQESLPTLIACRTVIGQGSPSYQGTSRTHGAPLGVEEVRRTKVALGLDPEQTFQILDGVPEAFRRGDGPAQRSAWSARLANHPRREEFLSWLAGDPSQAVERASWPSFPAGGKVATRKASAACLKALHAVAPWLLGGSADLAESNGVHLGLPALRADRFAGASAVHFGVREHGMAAICNGVALHGGLRPYNATFLVFHDYHRPAVRMSAQMHLPVLYLYSHDSLFLGEDGPTHQPEATLLALRALPGVRVLRPADGPETVAAWQLALQRKDGPTALILSRQDLPTLAPEAPLATTVGRGGYVVQAADQPALVLIGTGSEVALCRQAAERLAAQGVSANVVSMPCRELFWEQDQAWKDHVLPPGVPRLAVEAAVTLGWERWVGAEGDVIGLDSYGASGPASDLARRFGFTADQVAARALALLARRQPAR